MQDRVPTRPGRMKLTREDGTIEYVTMERADEPTQEGTPLNKATLLSDATAALLGDVNTPDEALALLQSLVSAVQSTANERAKFAYGSYSGTGTHGSSNQNRLTFSFPPKLVIIYGGSDRTDGYSTFGFGVFIYGASRYLCSSANGGWGNLIVTGHQYMRISGNTLTWYSSKPYNGINLSHEQLNFSGVAYFYSAFG